MIREYIDRPREEIIYAFHSILIYVLLFNVFLYVNKYVFDIYIYFEMKTRIMMLAAVGTPVLMGSFLLADSRKNIRYCFLCNLVGIGSFTLILFWNQIYRWAIPIIGAAFAATLIFIIAGFRRPISDPERIKEIYWKRIRVSYAMTLRIMGAAFAAVLVILSGLLYLDDDFKENVNMNKRLACMNQISSEDIQSSESEIEAKYDSLALLRSDEAWECADEQNQNQALLDLVCCDGRKLGISHDMKLMVVGLDDDVIAEWSEKQHAVLLSSGYRNILSVEELCQAVLHEVYHAYEHELCRLYFDADKDKRNLAIFKDVDAYASELYGNYKKGGENMEEFMDYYTQKCEEDARAHEETIKEYYDELDRIEKEREEDE